MTLHEFFNEASIRASEKANELSHKYRWLIFATNSITSTLISFVLIMGITQFIEMNSFMQIILIGCLGLIILNLLPHRYVTNMFTDDAAVELCRELDESTFKQLYDEALDVLKYSKYYDSETLDNQIVAVDFLIKVLASRNTDE